MSHTPTPWTVNQTWWDSLPTDPDDSETEDYEMYEDGDIRGPKGELIADVYLQPGDDNYKSDIAAANAAYIVKCVNSHDALVEALRSIVEDLSKRNEGKMFADIAYATAKDALEMVEKGAV